MSRISWDSLIRETLRPGRFFAPELTVQIVHQAHETIAWEIFRGHLLDQSQTRDTCSFESWDLITADVPAEPLISIKRELDADRLHVTRSILTYGWIPVETQPNVIESREGHVWRRELVGTIELPRHAHASVGMLPLGISDDGGATGCHAHARVGMLPATALEAASDLSHYLFLAFIGVSRLPITSLESPLPEFSLGQLAYFPSFATSPDNPPIRDPRVLLSIGLRSPMPALERAKLLETVLRAAAPADVPALAREFMQAPVEHSELLDTLFSNLALSHGTRLIENLPAFLLGMDASSAIDLLSRWLRQLGRHLTAFDLVDFHNQGANYPDALMLDALLKALLKQLEFEGAWEVLHHRGLRQAWILRKSYEGHRVPDAPTSPGENARVLGGEQSRVPDEQLLDLAKRTRRLFTDDPIERSMTDNTMQALRQSIADLADPAELRELGMALFLDRPLGVFKQPGEPDRTPLLSYEAFSRTVARRRLEQLAQWKLLSDLELYAHLRRLDAPSTEGIAAADYPGTARPGVVGLEDARRAAADFRFLRTTRRSLDAFLSGYDFTALKEIAPGVHEWLLTSKSVLLIRSAEPPAAPANLRLIAFDGLLRPRLELAPASAEARYVVDRGVEYLAEGLDVLRVWDQQGPTTSSQPRDFHRGEVCMRPLI